MKSIMEIIDKNNSDFRLLENRMNNDVSGIRNGIISIHDELERSDDRTSKQLTILQYKLQTQVNLIVLYSNALRMP